MTLLGAGLIGWVLVNGAGLAWVLWDDLKQTKQHREWREELAARHRE